MAVGGFLVGRGAPWPPWSGVEGVVCLSTPLLLPCLQTLVSYQPDSDCCLGLNYLEAKFQDNQRGGVNINQHLHSLHSQCGVVVFFKEWALLLSPMMDGNVFKSSSD